MDQPGRVQQVLRTKFGLDSLRPFQESAIAAALSGRDAVIIASTGSGKSLAYQLPALVSHTLTVVVSPLISLMQDQVTALESNGVRATFLGSQQQQGQLMEQRVLNGEFELVYLTPEKAQSFASSLASMHATTCSVGLVAIDEAHCISQWGHDFRPAFRRVAALREALPDVPCMALTATATHKVQQDICETLNIKPDAYVYRGSFNRANLSYAMRAKNSNLSTDVQQQLVPLIESVPKNAGSVVIYCPTRKLTDQLALALQGRKELGQAAVARYHAGMSANARTSAHEAFLMDRIRVLVATSAFGMGIDKRDVRLIIHYGVVQSIESYYQQTGRAGRDGLPSRCVLFFSPRDVSTARFLINNSGNEGGVDRDVVKRKHELFDLFMDMVQQDGCRRAHLLRYFSEPNVESKCQGCDRCTPELFLDMKEQQSGGPELIVLNDKERVLRNSIEEFRARVLARSSVQDPYRVMEAATMDELARYRPTRDDTLLKIRGMGAKRMSWFGRELKALIARESAQLGGLKTNVHKVTAEERRDAAAKQKLIDDLDAVRREIAERKHVPVHHVLSQQMMELLVEKKPTSLEQLQLVEGISEHKAREIGEQILAPIRMHVGAQWRAKATGGNSGSGGGSGIHEARFELFEQGTSIDTIAEQDGIKKTTVWSSIYKHLDSLPPTPEHPILKEWTKFYHGPPEAKELILGEIERVDGKPPKKVVKEKLPDYITWEHVNAAWCLYGVERAMRGNKRLFDESQLVFTTGSAVNQPSAAVSSSSSSSSGGIAGGPSKKKKKVQFC